MRRLLVALVAAVGILSAGPITLGPAGSVALAHAQLVSSTPGSGEVLEVAPTEVRLVFSEALDPRYSSADLLNAAGVAIVSHAGTVAPDDPRVLIVPMPVLAEGAFTLDWRTLSAADGHQASGFVSFGVGSVNPARVAFRLPGSAGDHSHDGGGSTLVEVQSRTVADLGFMLAFGFAVIALAVLVPAGLLAGWVVAAQALALLAAGVAGLLLALLSGSAPGIDPAGFLTATRPGQLLLGRVLIGLAVGTGVWLLRRRNQRAGVAIAGVAGAIGIVLVALGGHASGGEGAASIVAMLVHLGAASIWVAGIATLLFLAFTLPDPGAWLPRVVPRFSALALVSIALVALTGTYTAWTETHDLLSLGTQYNVALAIKVGVVAAALAVGGVNYLAGGRERTRLGGFRTRITVESALAVGVLVATANLASGSPPATERPVEIAAAPGSAAAGAGSAQASLALLPGRAGPNGFYVTADPAGPAISSAELRLDRLDTTAGESVVALRAAPGEDGLFVAGGITLPAGSRWDATVVLQDATGADIGRERFSFGLGAEAIVTGQAGRGIDPGLVVAVALLVAALLAGGFALAGGAPPRVDRTLGRRSLIVGSVVAAASGLVLLISALAA